MTRIDAIRREIAAIVDRHMETIEKKELTGMQISIRLFPNGGLVRKSTTNFEMEAECNQTMNHKR